MKAFRISIAIAVFALCALAPRLAAADSIGPLLEEDLLLSSGGAYYDRARAAFDGTKYFVVWPQNLTDPDNPNVWGRFLAPAGTPLGEPFELFATAVPEESVDVAWNGSEYLVVWTNRLYVFARVIEADGALGGVLPLSVPNHDKRAPAVASVGGDFLVIWHDSRNVWMDYGDVRGQYVDIVDGAPVLNGANIYVSDAPGDQLAAGLTAGIDSYFVAWVQETLVGSEVYDLYGAIVDPIGPPPSGTLLLEGVDDPGQPGWPDYEYAAAPELAFDGTNFLVTYKREGSVYALRVLPTGSPLGSDVLVSPAGAYPQVTFGNGDYLLAWAEDGIRGARVSTAGEVLDPLGVTLSVSPGPDQELPALASDGLDYLVTWQLDDLAPEPWAKYAQVVGPVDLTPEEQIEELIEEVADLGGGLVGKLEGALDKLDDGNPNNDASAIGQLNAFIQMVEAKEKTGQIPPEEADALIAAAQAIIDELQGG